MGKKMYEIGLMAQASPAEYDFETIDWEDDYDTATEARKRARELSKKCPYKDYHGREISAIQITCHSDEEGISSYYLHWSETFVNGRMIRRVNY